MPKRPQGPPPAVLDAVHVVQRGLSAVQRKLSPAPIVLMDIASSRWRSQALGVIARLGIADLLAGGPLSLSELATKTGAHEDSLYRVLHALARDGILSEPAPREFALTSLSDPLRTDHPMSVRHSVIQTTSGWYSRSWSDLEETVRTGEPAFQRQHGGKNIWGWFEDHPADAAHFHKSMVELTRLALPSLIAAYDFGPFRSIVDVGGGAGQLLAAVLADNPGLRGVVFDLEVAVKGAPEQMRAAGVEDRVEILTGSFLDFVPKGHDAYMVKSILHGHVDKEVDVFLGNVRDAMSPHARFLAFEMFVPEEGHGTHPSFMDLQMLVCSGGRERTRAEYEAVYARNGLRLVDVVRTASPFAIFVGQTR